MANSNGYEVVLFASMDINQAYKDIEAKIAEISKSEKATIHLTFDVKDGSIAEANKQFESIKRNFAELDDISFSKSYEHIEQATDLLKAQDNTVKQLNTSLKERNKIETEIARLENSKSYNTTAQKEALSAQQQLLEIETKRIESLQNEASQLNVSKDATAAKEKADLQLTAAQESVAASTKKNVGFLQNVVSGLKEATARIFDYTIAYRAIASVGQVFRQSIETAKELDKVMVDLQIVTGGTREEAQDLLNTYNDMAQALGSTTQAVAESANDFLRQGLSVKETNDMITASQYLSKLGMIDSAEATQYVTSATKGYNLEASEAISVVDKLTKVDINAAVSSGYLAEAMARTANSAQQAGVEMDTLIGYIATIGETTQRSASTVKQIIYIIIIILLFTDALWIKTHR